MTCRSTLRRFTPTCVGKLQLELVIGGSLTVHPHVCGETFFSPVTSNVASGSPPRVWGNFHLRALARPSGRFTPTCVGKLEGATLGSELLSVHPHVCGETATTTAKKSSSDGSPPRVWGNCLGDSQLGFDLRFTPTCVGKLSDLDPYLKAAHRFTPTCVGKLHA